jgi:methylenetetrahydrofolate reductase (NADPH)
MPKIIDKILQTYAAGETTVSFEYFPAKTEAGVSNLLNRISDMNSKLRPTFVTLTWRSAFKNENLWLKIGAEIQRYGLDVLLHLTCHLPRDDLKRVLQNAREAGIQNILALRGDPPIGEDKWKPCEGGFKNAIELVQLIREEHGDYFCVAVACYPEVHTDGWNSSDLPPSEKTQREDLARLKEKVDAGADFMVSQFFFDVDKYLDFIKKCKATGITVPILPGYLPIQTYSGFNKFTTWCKTMVPYEVKQALEKIKDNDEEVKAYGINLGIKTMRRLLNTAINHNVGFRSVHFYTMNLSLAVTKILDGLGLRTENEARAMPWGESREGKKEEDVRPIFWAHREASYLSRTSNWDEYPNGRWGDSTSPAYGELTDYYLAYKRPERALLKHWGEPKSELDVRKVFTNFIDGKVKMLPWCDQTLTAESSEISRHLRMMNEAGFLTINSQPCVNGAPSTDPVHGWGGKGGYVFQKAYVEFFCSREMFDGLVSLLPDFPHLSYHARNMSGEEYRNTREGANAVTWGVFPGREIIQPTVVDTGSFRVWSSEAFELWHEWEKTYKLPDPSKGDAEKKKYDALTTTRAVLSSIQKSFFLVNFVDNDYTNMSTSIFDVFHTFITSRMSRENLQEKLHALELENSQIYRKFHEMRRLHSKTEAELVKSNDVVVEMQKQIVQLQTRLRQEESQRLSYGMRR